MYVSSIGIFFMKDFSNYLQMKSENVKEDRVKNSTEPTLTVSPTKQAIPQ